MNNLYSMIWEMDERLANKSEVGDFNVLYAYAKLLVFDESVIIAKAKIDSAEYEFYQQEIKKIFDNYNVDYQLIYKAVPVGMLIRKDWLSSKQACSLFKNSKAEAEQDNVQKFLELILESNQKIITTLFAKGLSMTEVYRLLEGKPQIPRPQEKSYVKESVSEEHHRESRERQEDKTSAEKDTLFTNVFTERVEQTRRLYAQLTENIKGQDDAVRKFVQGYFESVIIRNQEKGKKRPQATFLFAGPPGVGKTYLAESVAEPLGYAYKRFDMSEYSHENDVFEINGTQKTYKNPAEGKVTSFVSANPKCILLFDEIEKAHKNVIYLFLQILEGGVIFDNYTEKKVSFQDTIIIFTTNVGKKLYENRAGKNLSTLTNDVILEALIEETKKNGEPAFPRELCSRFASGNIVMFNHLQMHHLVTITQKNFEHCVEMIKREYGIELELDERLAFAFLYNQGGKADVRIASSKSVSMIKQELYELGRTLTDEKIPDLDGTKSGKRAVLDSALQRRFSNRIYVDLPNEEERKRYIVLMLTKKKRIQFVTEEAIQNLAERTTELSLSILQNIIDLAIRTAVEEEKQFSDTCLLDAFENYQYGEECKWDETYYKSIAFHEAGHAYLAWLSGETPSYVTIISREGFGGYMQPANQEKILTRTREEMLWKIRISLAGRASEIVNFGEKEGINTGVSGDLRHATYSVMQMLCSYGMIEKQLVSVDIEVLLRSAIADKILEQVNEILNQQMQETIELVKRGNDKITRLAEALLKKNQLVGPQIDEILKKE